jgi:hypothetical protein
LADCPELITIAARWPASSLPTNSHARPPIAHVMNQFRYRHLGFVLFQHCHNLFETEALAFHCTGSFLTEKVRRKLAYIMALFTWGSAQLM